MTPSVRTFRGQLGLRFAATVFVAVGVTSIFAYASLHRLLYQQLDRSLLRMASIEAAAASDTPDSTVHFHEEIFLTASFGEEVTQGRFAQVWKLGGESVVRSRNLGLRDLPLAASVRTRVTASLEPDLFTIEWRGGRYRSVLYPLGLIAPEHQGHLLQIAASTSLAEGVLGGFARVLLLSTFLAAAVGMVLGWWIAGPTLRPVTEVIRQAEQIEMSGGTRRITIGASTEEMGRLVSVLNSMLSRIDAAFEAQRRFVSEVGHELRTPLTVLRGDIDVAIRRPRSAADYEAVLRQTLADLKMVSGLAENLIMLARGESGELAADFKPVDLVQLLQQMQRRYAGAAALANVRLTAAGDPSAIAFGDGILLEHALESLLDNAIRYGATEVHLEAGTEHQTHDREVARVWIRITDDGPGVAQHERDRVFERFVRGAAGRRDPDGSGLGLSIAKTIIENHGGTIEIESGVPTGAVFVVWLRAAASLGGGENGNRASQPERPSEDAESESVSAQA